MEKRSKNSRFLHLFCHHYNLKLNQKNITSFPQFQIFTLKEKKAKNKKKNQNNDQTSLHAFRL